MREKDDLDLTDLDQRRWVRCQLPIMVCVDVDEAGDQHVMAADHQYEPIVCHPDSAQRVPDRRAEDAAWRAISLAGHGKNTWVGEIPSTAGSGWKTPKTSPPATATPCRTPTARRAIPGTE
ncbi:hypothetical protein ACFXPA_46065 [Amycolatopsis sp. NPDC059090]|uniref:hypothetical protein n=1 Tax=Amycolatopsis sp. NPDC059090 TaxID=3346723 RepID=UPI00366E87AB